MARLGEKVAALPKGALTPLDKQVDAQATELSGGEPQKLIMQTDGEPVELIPDARYDAVQSEGFINIIDGTTDGLEPTLDEGLRAQAALDAAYRAVKEHRWVKISEITGKE